MRLVLGENEYDVGNQVAIMEKYIVYLCSDAEGKLLFLQIARENCVEHNSALDKSAYMLRKLKEQSNELEELYAKEHPGETVGYDRMFPEVVQSERSGEDRGCRVNILSIKLDPKDTVDIDKMVPLKKLLDEGMRVDEQTSVWIMGRLLKLLSFIHERDMTIDIKPDNVLLAGPEQYHNVVLFDWLDLVLGAAGNWRDSIKAAAKVTLAALGVKDGWKPSDSHPEYLNFLSELARGNTDGYADSLEIHHDFYEIVKDIWGIQYHPMTVVS
ncbi:hypothetical protein FACS189431_8170 [Alphaproteobacteria bacterium]|nr:hypothetical protein FACS189431_8170 [Alphaproteobacteria bacterium]